MTLGSLSCKIFSSQLQKIDNPEQGLQYVGEQNSLIRKCGAGQDIVQLILILW